MVEAQSSSVAPDILEKRFPSGVKGCFAEAFAGTVFCLHWLGRERISYGLSLRWRAIIGLSEAAGRRRLHKTFILNVTMSLHLKVFMVFLLQK